MINIESEKLRVNSDLGKLRESLKIEPIDKIELLRSINCLMSSLGYMKVKVIASINDQSLNKNQTSKEDFI